MAIQPRLEQRWRRKHDAQGQVRNVQAQYVDAAADLIDLCKSRPPATRLKAVGSHWALSEAAFSDGESIETNWPVRNEPRPRLFGLDHDLYHLINDQLFAFLVDNPPASPEALRRDPCIGAGFRPCFFVHLQAGTRIYEAYSLLDRGPTEMTELARRLNWESGTNAYDGPWAFETLGGAGGQTVFGALTTGTHGGDYRQKPISDSVMALHLITDGGKHYWIEPANNGLEYQLTDDDKLRQHFGAMAHPDQFEIIRADDVFQSVVVGVGRFGVVASLVLRVVPQYCLQEHRRLDLWSNVKRLLTRDPNGGHPELDWLYFPPDADTEEFYERFEQPPDGWVNRFLQISVSLSPCVGGDHRSGVTQRWFYPHFGRESRDEHGNIRGREERGTEAVAGKVGSYSPPGDDSDTGSNTSFISRACSSGDFLLGVFRAVAEEIDDIVAGAGVPINGVGVAALGIGAGSALLALGVASCPALAAVALLIRELLDAEAPGEGLTVAEAMDTLVEGIMVLPIPDVIKIVVLRVIFDLAFKMQESDRDYVAISYAVMDGHDYLDRSCYPNADSIEVFFDASRPSLYCAYVDQILSFESYQQEQHGKFSVGYVSLRYIQGSEALLSPARFPDTVAIEVSVLRDAGGSVPFIQNAAKVARNPMYNAAFHWGQRNPLQAAEVERLFGDRLTVWRSVLHQLTEDGTKDGFSSGFTRRTGLEPA